MKGYTRQELRTLTGSVDPERGFWCRKCKATIPLFAELPDADLAELKQLARSGTIICAIKSVRERTGATLMWASLWAHHHMHPDPVYCAECVGELATDRAQLCIHCGFNWRNLLSVETAHNSLSLSNEAILVAFIHRAWLHLEAPLRPSQVLIRNFGEMAGQIPESLPCGWTSPVREVWRISENAIVQVPLPEFERFVAVHVTQPWSSTRFHVEEAIFGSRTHEIAFAAFCEYPDAGVYYVEFQWGGRYGRGFTLCAEDGKLYMKNHLWVS